jgi:mannose-1-phosphate guanylyltransferase
MFIFPAGVMLQELDTYAPQIMQPLRAQGVDAYAKLEKLSIDYAVMEKTDKACVMPLAFGWDDLGDWNAVERLLKSADNPNVEMAQHLGIDTTGSIVYTSDDDEVIVTIGLEDVVVVRDGKATLVVHKSRTQDIKKAVKALGADPQFQHLL